MPVLSRFSNLLNINKLTGYDFFDRVEKQITQFRLLGYFIEGHNRLRGCAYYGLSPNFVQEETS